MLFVLYFGCDTKNYRTKDSIKLIEYVFQNYEYLELENLIKTNFDLWKENNLKNFKIDKGLGNNIDIYYPKLDYSSIPIKKEDKDKINVVINIETNLQAPVYENSKIGEISVYCNSEKLLGVNVLSCFYIPKKNSYNYFIEILKDYANLLNNFKI